MKYRLVFVHTLPSLVELFTRLSRELLPPETEIWHIADEILLKVVLTQGGLSPFIHRRVAEHAISAEECGATALQLTCSSISPCADSARPLVRIPILKIDEPMVTRALELGTRIGVAATAPTTLRPTSELIQTLAHAQGKEVYIESSLAEGAYGALSAGDLERHDAIVRDTLRKLAQHNDVILLAQASMARAAGLLPAEVQACPVLSSPRLALEHLSRILQEVGPAGGRR
jgi:Asp/Glu/hydantoin racemase